MGHSNIQTLKVCVINQSISTCYTIKMPIAFKALLVWADLPFNDTAQNALVPI
jgi:hypothetical protein